MSEESSNSNSNASASLVRPLSNLTEKSKETYITIGFYNVKTENSNLSFYYLIC